MLPALCSFFDYYPKSKKDMKTEMNLVSSAQNSLFLENNNYLYN